LSASIDVEAQDPCARVGFMLSYSLTLTHTTLVGRSQHRRKKQ
jgi:hypothetical protein